ncbi:MAG: tetratricopeptide repeat protein [Rhodothermales bacterium]|nr:tetratricopeptide repeat protein [Rhodothermales bacterium]
MRTHLLTLLLLLVLAPGSAAGQSTSTSTRVKFTTAREVLKTREFDRAILLLEEGLTEARAVRDVDMEASFEFNLGLALQQRSVEQKRGGDVARAITHYERYLTLQPESGSALNNLGKLYVDTGRGEEAVALYRRAIGLEDEYKAFYALNLANLLRAQGKPRDAAHYYQWALDERPDLTEARDGLNAVYAEADVPALITHLWEEIERRREVGATLAALHTLTRMHTTGAPDRATAGQKLELLTCVVVGLARARYGAVLFLPETEKATDQLEIARLLRGLTDDTDIGPGVREVIAAHEKPPALEDFPQTWWADKGDSEEDPDEGWWPREGYRILLRSLGDWFRHLDYPKEAEAYYLHALRLSRTADREIDLDALVSLSELYVERGDLDTVSDLMETYSSSLFQGKGRAYKTSDWRKIYAFHRTLGIMYATLGIWESDQPLTSAIFQLENALEKRDTYNDRVARRNDLPLLPIEPRLVTMLAQGYEAQGRTDRANTLRLEYAGRLAEERDVASARRLLQTVDASTLDRRQSRRYEELSNQLRGSR